MCMSMIENVKPSMPTRKNTKEFMAHLYGPPLTSMLVVVVTMAMEMGLPKTETLGPTLDRKFLK